jgi:hypothetical protein
MEQTVQKKLSQYDIVLNHLKSGKEITQLEATQKYRILRLGAIIFNLRKDGYIISTRIEHKPNQYGNISNYAVYKLLLKKYLIEWETCYNEDFPEQRGEMIVEAINEEEAAKQFDVFHAVIIGISEVKG